MRVAILISGGGSNMEALVRAMHKGAVPAEPVLVAANRADAGGLAKAAALGVPHCAVTGKGAALEADLIAALDAVRPDLVCLAGFMRVLSADFVARWPMLNIHPSLLPLFPGLDTHARALAAGVCVHGATVHEVTPALDAGPILGQATVPVRPGDTPEALAERLLPLEHQLYPAVLSRWIAGARGPFLL